MYSAIDHVALRVRDLTQARKFFEDVFGMSVIRQREKDGVVDSFWMDGGVQLLLADEDAFSVGAMDHVAFLVDDVAQTQQRAVAYGGNTPAGMPENWFQLPCGLVLELLKRER